MNGRFSHSPTLVGRPVWKRILRCIGLLCELAVRRSGVHFRRLFHEGRFAAQDALRLQFESPLALLRECARDLRTALVRMECRFDALPEQWTYDVGPCFERDANGSLRPNRDSDACMRDTESFQRERPTATLFDLELFHSGWAAGVQYARRTVCTEGRAGIPFKPSDSQSIPLRAKQRGC